LEYGVSNTVNVSFFVTDLFKLWKVGENHGNFASLRSAHVTSASSDKHKD